MYSEFDFPIAPLLFLVGFGALWFGGFPVAACMVAARAQANPPHLTTGEAMMMGAVISLAAVMLNLLGLCLIGSAEASLPFLVMSVLTLVGGPLATRYVCRTLARPPR